MAKIVLGIGTSHTPMLNAPLEDWFRFVDRDRERTHFTRDGRAVSYDELAKLAPPGLEAKLTEEVHAEKRKRALAEVDRIGAVIREAKLDALIVMGDDQKELFREDNLPALLIYHGETIPNVPLKNYKGHPFMAAAMSKYFEVDEKREYPVHKGLATHVLQQLMPDFDISSASQVVPGKGEGHAFGFIHNRLMVQDVPVVPVFINAYYPPNQPTPARCYKLGQAIRAAVESFPGDARVGVLASGGLSHFTVDEELDNEVIQALRAKDAKALSSIAPSRLQSGSSEIRNWICAAAALEHLSLGRLEYIPAYRSPAGTGMGLCFAEWN